MISVCIPANLRSIKERREVIETAIAVSDTLLPVGHGSRLRTLLCFLDRLLLRGLLRRRLFRRAAVRQRHGYEVFTNGIDQQGIPRSRERHSPRRVSACSGGVLTGNVLNNRDAKRRNGDFRSLGALGAQGGRPDQARARRTRSAPHFGGNPTASRPGSGDPELNKGPGRAGPTSLFGSRPRAGAEVKGKPRRRERPPPGGVFTGGGGALTGTSPETLYATSSASMSRRPRVAAFFLSN